jgi:ABC-2 type transport system permease protein
MMFEFFRFETKYWLRGFMIYVFMLVTAVLFGAATVSDNVQVGGAIGNTHRNAPYVIQQYYAISGVLCALMITAIYDSAASRDFTTKFSDILFSSPLKKRNYLIGRFLAASVIGTFPALGISLGIIVAGMIWGRDENWSPVHWQAHFMSFLTFAIPNTMFIGGIVFALAVWTRSTLYSFLGVLGLIVGYSVATAFTSELENEWIAALSDPFGGIPFTLGTKYWTPDQRNHLILPLSGMMLANRALWLTVAVVIFGVAAWRFQFETVTRRSKRRKGDSLEELQAHVLADQSWPKAQPNPRWLSQWFSATKLEIKQIMKSPAFIVMTCFALLMVGVNLIFGSQEIYGNASFPVTYKLVELIRASIYLFLLAIVTYFSGVVIWKDRDNRIHEIVGATPSSNGIFIAAHFASLVVLTLAFLASTIGLGCLTQACLQYTRFQIPVYLTELMAIDGLRFSFFIVAALVAHTIAPNKYLGYFYFVVFMIGNVFLWQLLRIDTRLVRFGSLPSYIYSDMFGIAPYKPGLIGFGIYWIVGAVVLLALSAFALHRGVPKPFRTRLISGFTESKPFAKIAFAFLLTLFAGVGGWLYYNTKVLNQFVGSAETEKRRVEYERKYQSRQGEALPMTTKINYEIDIFPETRNVSLRAKQTLVNRSTESIGEVLVNLTPGFDCTIAIPNSTLKDEDKRLMTRTYAFQPPMEPGQTLEMVVDLKSKTQGIENSVSIPELVQNGTFFNNQICPSFGYSSDRRLMEPRRRERFGLPPAQAVPDLAVECGAVCQHHYISNESDWVEVETIISTSEDQIAVAPGSLLKKWTEKGRNYFHYKLDHPSLNFYSFISARYEVDRSKVDDIDIEVYYEKEHHWNVPKMSKAMKDALAYCRSNFGDYKHKQARIIEFPRVGTFAQAFPGTMPYSESIGFIANLSKPDDIDMVYYVVSHEMAHQWWAHQVIGAKMQGATLLSETLAQYTALMIMKKEYGDDMMHKFLKYEMDLYLKSRGTERLKERPLMKVDPEQGYIHYRKGSVALYYLSEMIGEDRINAVLRDLIETYAYQGPPYPSSYALVDRLREHTPEAFRYLIKDLFEDITIFDNRTVSAETTKQSDGTYHVKLDVRCSKWKADEKGAETEVDMEDWLEIGAFAKQEPGHRYGKLLYREKVLVKKGDSHHEFVVSELPYQAGIDPRNLLVDRIADDNLKRVTVK